MKKVDDTMTDLITKMKKGDADTSKKEDKKSKKEDKSKKNKKVKREEESGKKGKQDKTNDIEEDEGELVLNII